MNRVKFSDYEKNLLAKDNDGKVCLFQEPVGIKALLVHVPKPSINRVAQTLTNLRETWENSTKEERKDLVHIMIQEVGVDVTIKHVLWVKARPDYEILFRLMDGLQPDAGQCY